MPTPNATHRKRLARALAAQTGLPYMAALDQVTQAATAGRLPSRLDEAGMQAALRILTDQPSAALSTGAADVWAGYGPDLREKVARAVAEARQASDPLDQPVYDLSAEYEALTGRQGLVYISSPGSGKDRYVFGSDAGGGKVILGRQDALAHITALVREARSENRRNVQAATTGQEGLAANRFHLEPSYLRLLRAVWQGRVVREVTSRKHEAPPTGPQIEQRVRELEALRDQVVRKGERPGGAGPVTVTQKRGWTTEEYREYLSLTAPGQSVKTRFTLDDKPVTTGQDIELVWLLNNNYITAPLMKDEEWAVARTTDFGDEVLAANGADGDKFTDGLPDRASVADSAAEPAAEPATEPTSANRITFADMQRCPKKSFEASHYRADGTCKCFPDPAVVTGFTPEGSSTGTVRGLLKVREEFVKAGRVEWWWHVGPHAGSHGFKTVEGIDDEDGSLILRDEDSDWIEPRTRLTLDYIDEPDKAERTLIWADHQGVTLRDKRTGEADASYRVAPPAAEVDPAPASREPRKVTVHRDRTPDPEPKPGSNEAVRAQLEANHVLEDRIGGWIKTQRNASPKPVRWAWADRQARRDTFAEIEVTYDDGHIEFRSPGDLPETARDWEWDRTVDRLLGGPYDTKVAQGDTTRRTTPRCDVCNRKLAAREPWWLVRSPNRDWENHTGLVCGMHHPDRLPPAVDERDSSDAYATGRCGYCGEIVTQRDAISSWWSPTSGLRCPAAPEGTTYHSAEPLDAAE